MKKFFLIAVTLLIYSISHAQKIASWSKKGEDVVIKDINDNIIYSGCCNMFGSCNIVGDFMTCSSKIIVTQQRGFNQYWVYTLREGHIENIYSGSGAAGRLVKASGFSFFTKYDGETEYHKWTVRDGSLYPEY